MKHGFAMPHALTPVAQLLVALLCFCCPVHGQAADILAEHAAKMAAASESLGFYAVDVESGYARLLFPWGGWQERAGQCAVSRDASMVVTVGASRPPRIQMGHVGSVLQTVWEPGHPADPVKDRYVSGGQTFRWPVWSWDGRRAWVDAWSYLVILDSSGKCKWFSSGEENSKVFHRLTRGGKDFLPDNYSLGELPVANFKKIRWAGKSSTSIVSTSDDGQLRIMDVTTGKVRVLCETPDRKGTGHPSGFAVSADVGTVAFFNDSNDRGGLYIWRRGVKKLRRIAEGNAGHGALSRDGRYVVCSLTRWTTDRGNVTSTDMFRADTGKLVWSEEVAGLHRFEFDSKSKRLACNGTDGGAHIIVTPVERFAPKRIVAGGKLGFPVDVRTWSADDREIIYFGTPPE